MTTSLIILQIAAVPHQSVQNNACRGDRGGIVWQPHNHVSVLLVIVILLIKNFRLVTGSALQ